MSEQTEQLYHINLHMKSGKTIKGNFYRRCEWTQDHHKKQILLTSSERTTEAILVQSLDLDQIEGISYEIVPSNA